MLSSLFLRSFVSKPLINATFLSLTLILVSGLIDETRAATIMVNAGGDFQNALDSANCGDEIVLQAGASFSETSSYVTRAHVAVLMRTT